MTQTPASGPLGLVTTPPMSSASTCMDCAVAVGLGEEPEPQPDRAAVRTATDRRNLLASCMRLAPLSRQPPLYYARTATPTEGYFGSQRANAADFTKPANCSSAVKC